jgi:hypothetical protein
MNTSKFAVLVLLATSIEAKENRFTKAIRDFEYISQSTGKYMEPMMNYQNVLTCDACKVGMMPV